VADASDAPLWASLVTAVSTLAMYIAKSWWDDRREAKRDERTQKRAREIVTSPEGTNDINEAVQQATIEAQLARVAANARKVRESMNPPMNGHKRTVPSLDLDITPLDKPTRKE
jgi:hypothetical protein